MLRPAILFVFFTIWFSAQAQFGGERMLINDPSEEVSGLVQIMQDYNTTRDTSLLKSRLANFDTTSRDPRVAVLYQLALAKSKSSDVDTRFRHLWNAVENTIALEHNDPLHGIAHASIGTFMMHLASYGLALEHLKKSMPYLYRDRLPDWERVTFNTWRKILESMKQMNQHDSIQLYESRLIRFASENLPKTMQAASYAQAGRRHLQIGQPQKAMDCFLKADSLVGNETTARQHLGRKRNLADTWFALGNHEKGTVIYTEILEKRLHNPEFRSAERLERLWLAFVQKLLDGDQEHKAIEVFDQFRPLIPDSIMHESELLRAWSAEIKIMRLKGLFDEADELNIRYHEVALARANRENKLILSRSNLNQYVEARSDLFKRELAAKVERAENLQTRLRLRNIILILLASLLLGLCMLFAQYRINRKKAHKHELEKEAYKLKLLDLENRNLKYENEVKEKSRSRIAADNKLRSTTRRKILTRLEKIRSLPSSKSSKELLLLQAEIDQSLQRYEKEDLLQQDINHLQSEFERTLRSKYKDLTPSEIELCSLLRLGLKTNEIQDVLGKSNGSIRTSKYRIRAKMGSRNEKDLESILHNI